MPKLSQRLDPALLSSVLSRALPPLGHQEISDLAEGFERLDQQRERLARLDEEVAATRVLADRQRTYARRVLRGASAALISATSAMTTLTRTARESAQEYDEVAASRTRSKQLMSDLGGEAARAEAEIAGLIESESYKQGRELDQLRQQVAQERGRAIMLRADAGRKRSAADSDAADAVAAERDRDRRVEAVRGLAAEVAHAAVRAGMASIQHELAQSTEPAQPTDSARAAEPAQPRRLLRAAVQARLEQVAAVRKALDSHDRAIARRQDAEANLEEARTALADAADQRKSAAKRYEAEVGELTTALLGWVRDCRELAFPDPGEVAELAESESALLACVDRVASVVLEDIARTQARADDQRQAAVARRDELADQIRDVSTRRDVPPDPPATRTADRSTMIGAPFWQLVDFAASAPAEVQGGIEAALAASGLLDAWVGPAGQIAGHDTFADPAELAPVPGRSLADFLVAEPDAALPTGIVHRLLASIACDDRLPPGHPAAIGTDGSWRLGNAHGSWHKEHPAHIGARARQRAREERLRELARLVAMAEQEVTLFNAEILTLRTRRDAVANERALRPGHEAVVVAGQAVTRAESDLAAADKAVRRMSEAVKTREQEVVAALRALSAQASEHVLPTERVALDTLAGAVGQYREQAESWLDEVSDLASAGRVLDRLLDQARRSAAVAGDREEEADNAEAEHGQLAAKLAAVKGAVGAPYQEVLAALAGARTRLGSLRGQIEATRAELDQLIERLGRLESAKATDATARDQAIAARDQSAERFRHLVAGVLAVDSGLAGRAGPEGFLSGADGQRAVLDAARQVAADWPAVPHSASDLGNALHRLSESVHSCRTALSARADLNTETDADVQVFTAVIDGIRVGAAELLRRLGEDAERSRQEITDRERELFDRTLTGDIRRHLADRIRQANDLVDRMNARLERVRTASKIAVRLVWQVAPDLPAGTKAARDLLLKDPLRLTDADRDSLHRFFRERIDQAKTDNTASSWEQQLEQVFDYTAWHQFVVKLDRANGAGWQLLTRKLHGALSGGEKAIALHLPLFAAVAAHYQAVPKAPRLILLDEVFVGVDTSNRGQIFGLLSALDLDLVLTSDHEWCTYAELSGIGIHQLITGADGDDAVTTARFTWDGRELVHQDGEI